MQLVYPPPPKKKFCPTSPGYYGHPQEKLKTMVMQTFGGKSGASVPGLCENGEQGDQGAHNLYFWLVKI